MYLTKTYSQKVIKYLFYALLGSILLTISAKIRIPFYPVPMTMQTFVVMFLGITLGSRVGAIAVIFYLLEGILGLPVFSNSPEKGIGIVYFTGPTMGYLIGFIFSAYLIGYFNLNKSFVEIFFKLLLSVSIIYLIGFIWLGILIGWNKPIFDLGVKPFLWAELFKVLLLAFLTKYFLKFRRFI